MFSLLIKRFLFIFTLALSTQVYAQTFTIINTEAKGGKVYVDFQITGKYDNERYRVQLYSSKDNFQSPLQNVTGPIAGGKEITQSQGPFQVVWDAQRELKEFEGNIQLELRGQVSYVPIHTEQTPSAKQGKSTLITWGGGNPQDQIKIDLIQNGQDVKTLGQVTNSGQFNWDVGKSIPKGAGYKIKLTNTGNSGETEESGTFKVSKKGGAMVFIIPLAVVAAGGGAYVLLGSDDAPGGGGEAGVDPLPEALGPPN